jgi:C_GCAxxG_C_C family probable redox protein
MNACLPGANDLNSAYLIGGGWKMDKTRQDIQDRAFDLTKKYEMENGACAQCVVAGVLETLGMENNDVFRSATGFADGIGLTGDGPCGALSGGVMVISYIFGRKREEFNRRGKTMKALLLSRQLRSMFIEKYGACRCYDLQTKFYGRFFSMMEPADMEAAVKAGVIETCSTLAGEIARMTVQLVQEQQDRDAAKLR